MNFPMGFVWQQVIVKKCCLPLLCIFIFVCFTYLLPSFLTLSPLLSLSLCFFDISLLSRIYRDRHSKNSHAPPHLADPRTPEAVCQLQLVSSVHCAVVTQNITCWSVHVCSLMIDTTFQLKQIVDINQATEEASKYSSIQEFTRVKAVITKTEKNSLFSTPAPATLQRRTG